MSSDLPEVLTLSDRVLVMREGRIRGELGAGADEEQVMRLATTAPRGSRVKAIWRVRELSTAGDSRVRNRVLRLVPVAGDGRPHPFLNAANGLLVLKYSSIYGIAAVGAAIVIICGGIDLAPGAIIALLGRRRGRTVRRRRIGASRRARAPACWQPPRAAC